MTETLIQQSAFEALMRAYHEYGGTGRGFRKCLEAYEAAKSSEIRDIDEEAACSSLVRLLNREIEISPSACASDACVRVEPSEHRVDYRRLATLIYEDLCPYLKHQAQPACSLPIIKQIIDTQIANCADDATGRTYKLACENVWNLIEGRLGSTIDKDFYVALDNKWREVKQRELDSMKDYVWDKEDIAAKMAFDRRQKRESGCPFPVGKGYINGLKAFLGSCVPKGEVWFSTLDEPSVKQIFNPEIEDAAPARESGWLPIDTAPKDGNPVMIWLADEGFAVKANWRKPPMDDSEEECWWCFEMDLCLEDFHSPTHWHPCLKGPTEIEDAAPARESGEDYQRGFTNGLKGAYASANAVKWESGSFAALFLEAHYAIKNYECSPTPDHESFRVWAYHWLEQVKKANVIEGTPPARESCREGWIEWRGGKQPVRDDVIVEILLRQDFNQRPSQIRAASAVRWDWIGYANQGDVMCYRIVRTEIEG